MSPESEEAYIPSPDHSQDKAPSKTLSTCQEVVRPTFLHDSLRPWAPLLGPSLGGSRRLANLKA